MTDPISEGQSRSPEVDERACRGERKRSGGACEKLEELRFAMEEEEYQFVNLLEAKMEQLEDWQRAARHGPQCQHHRRLCRGFHPYLVDHLYSGKHIVEARRHDLQDGSL